MERSYSEKLIIKRPLGVPGLTPEVPPSLPLALLI
jgi:hypothetical protein